MASVRKLRQAEIQLLQTVKEDHLYVCGSTIFTEDSDMAKVCCVGVGLKRGMGNEEMGKGNGNVEIGLASSVLRLLL